MTQFIVAIIIFIAVFTQSLAGFGAGLVAMALLPELLGIRVATPLVALVAITVEMLLLVHYWEALNFRAVWRVALASVFGIPVGILMLKQVDEDITKTILGLVISGYALYALVDFRLPDLKHPAWAYGAGLLGGLLGGAYNTSGPPLVIYGSCRCWQPAEFKGNLQGFFLLNGFLVIAMHALSRNFTPLVWANYLWALPAIGLGVLVGMRLDRRLNPASFRRVVLWLLVLMGLRMVF